MVANPNIESSCSGLLDNSDPGGPYAGQEGAAVSIAGSVSDVDGPGLSSTWSITPASGVDPGTICSFGNPAATSTTLTCNDDGVFTLTLTGSDGFNPPVSRNTTLTLSNVAPAVSITAPANGSLFVHGTAVSFTAPFTDIGTHDTHTCAVDFADGTPVAAGTVTETPGSGTCTITTHSPRCLTIPGVATVSSTRPRPSAESRPRTRSGSTPCSARKSSWPAAASASAIVEKDWTCPGLQPCRNQVVRRRVRRQRHARRLSLSSLGIPQLARMKEFPGDIHMVPAAHRATSGAGAPFE